MTHTSVSLHQALEASLDRIRRHHRALGDRFPTTGEGCRYRLGANDNWLAGFWTGLLWLAYAATGDRDLRAHAEALLPSFARRLEQGVHITHDLGFLFTLSARAQWQLTGDEAARELALRAASRLAGRYRPAGRYVQAWGAVGDPAEGGRAIVDTMMNLPLLFWAARETGDEAFYTAAREHAATSRRYLLRPDGAAYHTFFFDQESGRPLGPRTHQGYADDSLWARGQGWAIYGFALAAEWTGEREHLETARRAAGRFLAELPPGGVPTWDLRLPEGAPRHPDSSAGAIAAGGLLRLAAEGTRLGTAAEGTRLGEAAEGTRLGEAAESTRLGGEAATLLEALVSGCLETDPAGQGLLRHGTYHAHKGLGVDAYFICGDYFFLEALLAAEDARLATAAENARLATVTDFWGLGDRG